MAPSFFSSKIIPCGPAVSSSLLFAPPTGHPVICPPPFWLRTEATTTGILQPAWTFVTGGFLIGSANNTYQFYIYLTRPLCGWHRTRAWNPRFYFLPIKLDEMNRNNKLVQKSIVLISFKKISCNTAAYLFCAYPKPKTWVFSVFVVERNIRKADIDQ
jgi:hypothetical protein